MTLQQARVIGVGRTLAEIERSVVEQARGLAGDEWRVHYVTIGMITASDSEDIHTEAGVRRTVQIWEAEATVSLTSVESSVDPPRDHP